MLNFGGLGAVYRSDGRKYGELAMLAVSLGVFLGVITGILSLVFGSMVFPNFVVGLGSAIIVAFFTFIFTTVAVVSSLIVSALIYDFGNFLMDR